MKNYSHNFKKAILPFILINWFFGLSIFEYPLGKPRQFLSSLYIVVSRIIYLVTFYYLADDLIRQPWYQFLKLSFFSTLAFNVAVYIFTSILSLINAENINAVLTRCEALDKSLAIFGIEKNYKKLFRRTIMCIFFWLLFIIITFANDYIWITTIPAGSGVYYSPIISAIVLEHAFHCGVIADLTFAFSLCYGKSRLSSVNKVLRNRFGIVKMTEIESKENIHRRFILQQYSLLNSIEKFICVVRHLHRETCTIVHVMNQVYSKSILLELIGHFTHILFILYALYFTIGSISLANFPNLINIIYTTIWLIYFVSKFVITNILGQAVSNEAALTKQILQEINPSYLQDEARKELQQFAMQLELCPLNVCAAGFLTLDNAFTTHFFGGVTTYLVIFIQMSSSSSAYATV